MRRIQMALEINKGGNGVAYFTGLLDRGPLPPTIGGFVSQIRSTVQLSFPDR